jgi:opacity protein-like surface antigen
MTKRLVACAAVLVLVLPSVASAARDPRAPLQRHTAADTKRAKAIVLRLSDFATGWKLDPPAKPNPPGTAGPDESSFVQTAKVAPSFTYKDGVTNVGSEADVFRSAIEAQKDWNASTASLLGTCLLQSASAGFGQKVHVRLASTKTLPAPKGAERTLHYRYVLSVRSAKTTKLVVDVVALGRGRIAVVLYALTIRSPLPASAVNALTGVLAKRLSAGHGITA